MTASTDRTFPAGPARDLSGRQRIVHQWRGGLHKVHADDDRFICSLNCTTSNAPSTELWQALVHFDRLGTFGYYCEAP
ncbi:MAG: hypothetical protein WBW92_03680 [Rhodanobacteraceae bacterium]